MPSGVDYLHITSNNTIYGTQWHHELPQGGAPLFIDVSSDFLSRPMPVERYGVIYAGAQKNAGPAGVTVVIVRRDLVERAPEGRLGGVSLVNLGAIHVLAVDGLHVSVGVNARAGVDVLLLDWL